MRGRGTCRVRCRYWIDFDHLTEITAPDLLRCTSDLQRCLEGSNFPTAGISRFDFRKNEKKPTRQAAQKVRSKGRLKSRTDKMPNNRSAVIGSFWCVLSPLCRRRPFMIDVTYQLLATGLGYPASRCMSLTILRYWRTDEKHNLEAKKAM